MNYKEIVLWQRELVNATVKNKNKSCWIIKWFKKYFKKDKIEKGLKI